MTNTDQINRIGWGLGAFAALLGIATLVSAQWSIPMLLPAVKPEVFAFAPSFLASGAFIVVALWALSAMLYAIVFSEGHWRPATRRLDFTLDIAWVATLLWLVIGPQVFQSPTTDSAAKFWVAVVLVIVVASIIPKMRRAMKG